MLMQPMLIILTLFCDIIRVRAHNFLMPSTDDAYAVLEHAGVQKSYMNGIMNGRTDGLGFTEKLARSGLHKRQQLHEVVSSPFPTEPPDHAICVYDPAYTNLALLPQERNPPLALWLAPLILRCEGQSLRR